MNHRRALLSLLTSALCFLTSAIPLRAQDVPAPAFQIDSNNFKPPPDLKAVKKPVNDRWKFTLLPVGLHKNPQIDYAIMSELTNEGRKLPEPSFDHPVYYISDSLGQIDAGDAYGGTKDIPYEKLRKILNTSLASNGYRPADEQHPPSQILFFAWGMHNMIEAVSTEEPISAEAASLIASEVPTSLRGSAKAMSGMNSTDEFAALVAIQVVQNLRDRAKTIGGQKFANEFAAALADQIASCKGYIYYEIPGPLYDFAQRDDTTETLVYAIFNDCYYVIVCSLDYEALKSNQRKPLWNTRISTISRGVDFEQTLPIMINNGSWFFGRETAAPEILRKRAYKHAEVNIGEATVVDYLTGTTTSVAKPATSGTAAPAR